MTEWPVRTREILRAVAARIVPRDADAGALESGADGYAAARLADEAAAEAPAIRAALDALGPAFLAATPETQDAQLREVEDQTWFRRLADLVTEGFYADPGNGGNADGVSWRMIGYEPRLPDRAARPPPLPTQAAIADAYDVVVVGAGAGGGIAACVLAEAGFSVLLVERGGDIAASDPLCRDHLRNQRLPLYGHNAGPPLDGAPRVAVAPDGRDSVVRANEAAYQNNAAAIGGGTPVYGAQAWRFHPDDFRMASRYGVPAGSSLADWPFGYDELEPWYARAEQEIGVAGEPGHPGERSTPFPMPPVPGHRTRTLLEAGADALGIGALAPPLLINTVPRHGRAACIECGSCVGFLCPSDGKNGTQNTVIPRALATGRCTLVAGVVASRIETGVTGKVTGVTLIDGRQGAASPGRVAARAVVLAGGAVETARLLLLSADRREPAGLGNAHDQVGRNLQGHFSPFVYGRFASQTYDARGPGVTVATTRWNHGNPGVIGGSMVADDFIMVPAIFWKRALPPGVPRWGAGAKAFMRENYRYIFRVFAPVQEIPNPDARVTLDPAIKDRHGLPVARLSGQVHPETLRTAEFMRERAEEWLHAAGALETWCDPLVPRLSGGQHQAGTCRMGVDPAVSVTDAHGRVWGHDNLVVADGSLHPTNGGFNPVLTIMALAFRNADALARRL